MSWAEVAGGRLSMLIRLRRLILELNTVVSLFVFPYAVAQVPETASMGLDIH
jgi:hypothetical protein